MKTKHFILILALLFIATYASAQPIKYRNNSFLTVAILTTQETIDRLVPEPFITNKEGILLFNMGELKIEGSYEYNELLIFIPVELNGKQGFYVPSLYLDNFWGIVYGREIWGLNKILATCTSRKTENEIIYDITVLSQKFFDLKYKCGASLPLPEAPEYLFFTFKKIPSAEDASLEVNQIISVPFSNARYLSYQKGEAQVEIFDIREGGLGQVPVLKVLDASYSTIDFDLPYGKIEVDYNIKKNEP